MKELEKILKEYGVNVLLSQEDEDLYLENMDDNDESWSYIFQDEDDVKTAVLFALDLLKMIQRVK